MRSGSPPIYRPPPCQGLDLLYLDDHLLVINKPSGLLSVPGRGEDKQDCLITRVQRYLPDALVVHRLDMETSGLLLLARDKQTQRELGRLFQTRNVQKQYQAIVTGHVQTTLGEIHLPLSADWPNRPRQKVDFQKGKPSHTHYQVLALLPENRTRICLIPTTGRSHQLRVHMSALGHPIMGDPLYSCAEVANQAPRLLLHAEKLGLPHPIHHFPLRIQSPPPF